MSCLVPQTPTCLNHNEQLRCLGAELGFGGSPGTLKSDGRPQSPDPRDPASQRWLRSGVQVLEAAPPLTASTNPPKIRVVPDVLPTQRAKAPSG